MSSVVALAKTEEPKMEKDLPKKVLIAKKNFKDQKNVEKITLKVIRGPFQQCVLNNSINLFAIYYTMGIPLNGEYIQAAATVQCMAEYGLLP